ncbi:site-specific integrase [Aureimonas phyllosphaerae]|uniref:site-specific integrase n=1 Tax=Aureimonas phyllosphaerae TaxID=1166078 RepID=UPI003A5C29BC
MAGRAAGSKSYDDDAAREDFLRFFKKQIDAYLDDKGLRIHPDYVQLFEHGIARAVDEGIAKALHMQFAGDFSPDPAALRYPPPQEVRPMEPKVVRPNAAKMAIVETFDDYVKASKLATSTRKRWGLSMGNLKRHLAHDDLRMISTADVADWIAALRASGLSKRMIRDVHLAALKALMSWLVGERRLSENPASGFRIKVPKATKLRNKGLTDEEAKAILEATLEPPSNKLGPKHAAARRWIPWLCAYTGARVNELTQLRREDVIDVSGIACIRITPEAGSVKTGQYRDVPIHPHLIEQGFLTFARRTKTGPIFYDPKTEGEGSAVTPPYKKLGERLARWVRASTKVVDPRVDPFHG